MKTWHWIAIGVAALIIILVIYSRMQKAKREAELQQSMLIYQQNQVPGGSTQAGNMWGAIASMVGSVSSAYGSYQNAQGGGGSTVTSTNCGGVGQPNC